MQIIKTKNAPVPGGPYSQAVIANGFIFCAGQIGREPQNGILAEGIENQTRQILKNLKAILAEAGSDLEHVTETTVFIRTKEDYPKMNEVYQEFFNEYQPPRATAEVGWLPGNALIAMKAIAVVKKSSS